MLRKRAEDYRQFKLASALGYQIGGFGLTTDLKPAINSAIHYTENHAGEETCACMTTVIP